MDYKLFLRVFSSHAMKMPAQLLREQHCNQFPNVEMKMSRTFNADLPKAPHGLLKVNCNVNIL